MLQLNGTVALVTGGGQGIGQAISTKLAEYGAAVAVTDADGAKALAVSSELTARGLAAEAFAFDVTDWAAAQQTVRDVETTLGAIGILVNNAGVTRHIAFLDIEDDEWDRLMDVNVKGVYHACRAVLPGMIERRAGRVVNLSSMCGRRGYAMYSHYSASKFAVIGLSQSIADEVAPYDVTVNCVCPGIIAETPMQGELRRTLVEDAKAYDSEAAVQEFLDSIVPLGRAQTAEDVAEMVAYLASDLARNMTGCSYDVNGGVVFT